MWFKNIFRPKRGAKTQSNRNARTSKSASFTIDEAFLRRLERLNLLVQPTLKGTPSSGEHASRQRMPATIFAEHRPYSTGDDYRYVDWNAYGRHDQIVVKLGEAEQDVEVHVLLDCSRSMAWGTPPKLVTAQQLAAALGYLSIARSDKLRVAPFGTTLLPGYGPVQSKNRIMDFLRFIATVKANEQTALARVLKTYASMYQRGGLLVICSDLLNDAAQGLAEGLRALPPPRWQVLVLHLIDPRELQPPLSGPIELEDAETGERLHLTLDQETVDAYKQNLCAWQEQIADICARRGASYAQIMTDWPLERAVVPYLRVRRILR